MSLLNVHGEWVNTDKPGGRVFFVGGGTVAYRGKAASDANSGLSPEQPLSTATQAHTQCVAGRGDTIVILPGTVNVTTPFAITKSNVTLRGYTEVPPHIKPPCAIATSTDSVSMIESDANYVTIEYLYIDHNTTTADVQILDVGDTSGCEGVLIRNCWFDLLGSATDTDGIRFGDGSRAVYRSVIEGCTFEDYDQDAIVISNNSDENVIRNCWFWDEDNTGRYAVELTGDNCLLEGNKIQTKGTAGFYINGLKSITADNRIWGFGDDTIGILAAAGKTFTSLNDHIACVAAGNMIDFTTSATSPSSTTSVGNVTNTNPATPALITATVGGS